MLESLFVKDFAIVESAEIHFKSGLTVVTGETGAGKSLLVDALLLLTGSRADAGMVRHGCERAELSATFDISARPAIQTWLSQEELDEENACQIRRVVRSEGSSRAWINGRPVTLTQLSALGEKIIEIHGQHEHQALLDRTQQMGLLDAFGNHATELAEISSITKQWRTISARIAELARNENPEERIQWLEHQVTELDRYALTPQELDELEEIHRRLANAGQLLQGCASLAELLDGDNELALLTRCAQAHSEATRLALLDPQMNAVLDLLTTAHIQLGEANDTLMRFQTDLDLDPDRLAEIEHQLSKLHELSRKHRVPMPDLKTHAETLRSELDALQNVGVHISTLKTEQEHLAQAYSKKAKKLSAQRLHSAQQLSCAVTELMAELGMAGGCFEIALEPSDNNEPNAQGSERCEFLVSANPGQPPRPLRKVASGGELSRISLAIEVAALGLDAVGTMVFDEVDSGIGGAVAEVVGHKLRRLGEKRQVLCVTHLPQVAALGHHHLRVNKATQNANTSTMIEPLTDTQRCNEIARMLGGIQITPETLAHAQQMLDRALTSH